MGKPKRQAKDYGVQSTQSLILANTRLKSEKSEEKFLKLADFLPNQIFVQGKERILYVNDAARQVMGYTKDEFYSPDFSFLKLIAPESIKLAQAMFKKHSLGKYVPPLEYSLITRNGLKISAIVATKLITYSGQNAILGIVTDITEQKKNEEALRWSQQEKAVILDTIPEIVIHLDRDYRVIWVNKKGAEYTGLASEQIIGKRCYKIWHNRRRPCLICAPRKTWQTGKLVQHELSGKDGRNWLIKVQPIKDKDNRVLSTVEILTDITWQKKKEEGLRRDKDKIQRELDDARRLSDIGTLAATVAHELRNPLGVIRAALYNMRMKQEGLSLTKHINNIEKKVLESDQIIENLLNYSRMKIPKYSRVAVLKVIDECISYCRHKYSKWDVQIEIVNDWHEDVFIEADHAHMNALFSNILDNAYQSFPDMAGAINIAIKRSNKKNMLHIVFEDNGSGIDKGNLPKVFEPFFTTRARGIGLGLSVCRQLVSLSGGSIYIKSRQGKGTCVHVFLPIKKRLY